MKTLLFALLISLVPLKSHSQEPCIDPYYSELHVTGHLSTKSRDLITLEVYVPSFLDHYKDGNKIVILNSYVEGAGIFIIEEMVQLTQVGGDLQVSPRDEGLQLVRVVKGNDKLTITYKK